MGDKVENKTEANKPAVRSVPAKKTVATTKRTRSRSAPKKEAIVPVVKAGKPVDVTNPEFYLNREINWIDFDRKVLEQAEDKSVPLLERVKFLSIFFNNLDEFFMVRVANVWKQVQSGAEATGADKLPPRRQLSEIGRRVRDLTDEAEELWKKGLLPELEKQSIRIVDYAGLPQKKREILSKYFDNEIFPILTPQAIDSGHPFPLVS
ncbi:MAG TPA: RNA degradosome polyphosphate kinase, partial [Candidatus Aphodousia faecavium]|nr:RNA degradosome polyphosphate kinase [Candidatus Aphodousia faecavium]